VVLLVTSYAPQSHPSLNYTEIYLQPFKVIPLAKRETKNTRKTHITSFHKHKKCISEGLRHVAAWHRETSGPKFIKFREYVSIGQAPNTAKFRRALTKSAQDTCGRKFLLPEKVEQSSSKSLKGDMQ